MASLMLKKESTDSFSTFYKKWVAEQDQHLHALLAAVGVKSSDAAVQPLINKVVSHYENYYQAKMASTERDVLTMFTPTWTTSTQNLFLWVTDWRPSMAFHLLHSKLGIPVETRLGPLSDRVRSDDLADLTPAQRDRIDLLQRRTISLEEEISADEAAAQVTVVDPVVVRLCHAMTEGGGTCQEMEGEMKGRREAMERVVARAEKLRIETLKGVVEILRPMQAVHFLIGAAEIHFRVYQFGKRNDGSGH